MRSSLSRKHPSSIDDTIGWILLQFKNMGATDEQLKQEELAMLTNPNELVRNLSFFED